MTKIIAIAALIAVALAADSNAPVETPAQAQATWVASKQALVEDRATAKADQAAYATAKAAAGPFARPAWGRHRRGPPPFPGAGGNPFGHNFNPAVENAKQKVSSAEWGVKYDTRELAESKAKLAAIRAAPVTPSTKLNIRIENGSIALYQKMLAKYETDLIAAKAELAAVSVKHESNTASFQETLAARNASQKALHLAEWTERHDYFQTAAGKTELQGLHNAVLASSSTAAERVLNVKQNEAIQASQQEQIYVENLKTATGAAHAKAQEAVTTGAAAADAAEAAAKTAREHYFHLLGIQLKAIGKYQEVEKYSFATKKEYELHQYDPYHIENEEEETPEELFGMENDATSSNTWVYASAALTAAAVGYHVYNKNAKTSQLSQGLLCRV